MVAENEPIGEFRCKSCGTVLAPIFQNGVKTVIVLADVRVYMAVWTCKCGTKTHFHSRRVA